MAAHTGVRPATNISSSLLNYFYYISFLFFQLYEASLGFQGSTFQVPLPPATPVDDHRNHTSPELIAELL